MERAEKKNKYFTFTHKGTGDEFNYEMRLITEEDILDFYIEKDGQKIEEFSIGDKVTLVIEFQDINKREITIDFLEQNAIFEDNNKNKVIKTLKVKANNSKVLREQLQVIDKKEPVLNTRKEVIVISDKKGVKINCKAKLIIQGSFVYFNSFKEFEGLSLNKENFAVEYRRIEKKERNATFMRLLNKKSAPFRIFEVEGSLSDGETIIKEVPMPNIIKKRHGVLTIATKYQKYDYMIAAMVYLFNLAKNNQTLKLQATNGLELTKEEVSMMEDLNPTLVKAMIMEESVMGTISGGFRKADVDIMQVNVNGDWGSKGKSNLPDLGLKKGKSTNSPEESVFFGIRWLALKGYKHTDLVYSTEKANMGEIISYKITWLGWEKATLKYNGGGSKKYDKEYEAYKMYKESISPENIHY